MKFLTCFMAVSIYMKFEGKVAIYVTKTQL